MRISFLISLLILCSNIYANSSMDIQKAWDQYRVSEHAEKKKWDAMKLECDKNYPNYIKSSHPDYDLHFKCMEDEISAERAFEAQFYLELCKKVPTLDRCSK